MRFVVWVLGLIGFYWKRRNQNERINLSKNRPDNHCDMLNYHNNQANSNTDRAGREKRNYQCEHSENSWSPDIWSIFTGGDKTVIG